MGAIHPHSESQAIFKAFNPELIRRMTELSAICAFFQKGGNIFAPAWIQTLGLEGSDPFSNKINMTTLDFYFVPKLANPNYYVTFDPALIYDWEQDRGFASFEVTFGMLTGPASSGDGQVFVKPEIYAGVNRPPDFSVQVGYKVLNF